MYKSSINNKSVVLFFQLFFFISTSQNALNKENDTLSEKDFKELKSLFFENFENKNLAFEIALYTLNKAKKENYSDGIINSYMRLSRVTRDNLNLSLSYIDSSLYNAELYKNQYLLAESQFYKARVLFIMKNYAESLSFYLKSREFFKNESYMYNLINYNIGFLKLRIKADVDALNIFKECYEYEKSKENNYGSSSYLSTLYGLSIAYAANKMYDTVSILNKRGYDLAKNNKRFNELDFTHIEGGNQFLKGNYLAAKDSLIKVVPYLKTIDDIANLSIAYYYLGRIYEDLDKPQFFLSYYEKIDSIFKKKKFIIQTPREAYVGLINYYKKEKKLKKQLYYVERLLSVDSTLHSQYENLSTKFFEDYDTPELLNEQKEIISQLDKSSKNYKYITILLVLVTVILALLLRSSSKKKKKNEERFNKIIQGLKTKEEITQASKTKEKSKRKLEINEETIEMILSRLDSFENEKEFLKPKITLVNLAKKINTNSKYLSKVINEYKSKSFNNYINGLRITYTIDQLEKDKTFRKYTIKAIANDVGFSTTEAFTVAFKKNTGLTVSYFIKRLNS